MVCRKKLAWCLPGSRLPGLPDRPQRRCEGLDLCGAIGPAEPAIELLAEDSLDILDRAHLLEARQDRADLGLVLVRVDRIVDPGRINLVEKGGDLGKEIGVASLHNFTHLDALLDPRRKARIAPSPESKWHAY